MEPEDFKDPFTGSKYPEVDPLMDDEEEKYHGLLPNDVVYNGVVSADHEYCYMHNRSRKTVESMSILKSLGLQMLMLHHFVKYDGESLAICLIKKSIFEKKCILDREFNINIYVRGKKIGPRNFIWVKYPKRWIPGMDLASFMDDLFVNWHVCQPFANDRDQEKTAIAALKAEGQEDRYRYDAVFECIRSLECTYLTTETVCYYCRKLETYLESVQTISCSWQLEVSKDRQAKSRRAELALLRKNVPRTQLRKLHLLKKKSDEIYQDLLKEIFPNSFTDAITETSLIFHRELVKVRKSRALEEWDPMMIQWCVLVNKRSADLYAKLQKIVPLPSVVLLERANNQQEDDLHALIAEESPAISGLQVRKDLFSNNAQPSTSSATDEWSWGPETEEARHYHDIETAQLLKQEIIKGIDPLSI